MSALSLALSLIGCTAIDLGSLNSPLDEGLPSGLAVTTGAPTGLFVDPQLTPVVGTNLATNQRNAMFSISGTTDLIQTTVESATFTFQGNGGIGRSWSGGVAIVAAPVNLVGAAYDLTQVTTIRFLIRTAIPASKLSLTLQVRPSADQGVLKLSTLASGSSLERWTEIRVPLGTVAPALSAGDKKRVVLPLVFYWGSSPTDTTSVTAGQSFQIAKVAFLDAAGQSVNIAAGLSAGGIPTYLQTVPNTTTYPAGNVTSLYSSSATYTDVPVADWNPDWLQKGYLTTAFVSGRWLKVVNLANYQGINLSSGGALNAVDSAGTPPSIPATYAPLSSASRRSSLHFSVWSSTVTPLNVNLVSGLSTDAQGTDHWNSSPVTLAASTWQDVEIPTSVVPSSDVLSQIGFSNAAVAGSNSYGSPTVLYLDNIYFH